jgi:hypothetical protein
VSGCSVVCVAVIRLPKRFDDELLKAMMMRPAFEIDFGDWGACAPPEKSHILLKRFEEMASSKRMYRARRRARRERPSENLAVPAARPALSPSLTAPASESNKHLVRGRLGPIESRSKEQRCL